MSKIVMEGSNFDKKIKGQSCPETVIVGANNAATAPVLERVYLFLEGGKWQDADIYCEKVLDIDPKNAEAYLGKLMVELQVRNRKQLADCVEPFDDRDNYRKVLRFGDEALEKEMRGYITYINDRNENARLTGIYNSAKKAMDSANTKGAFKAAADTFATIPGFKDADTLAEQCCIMAEKADKKRKKAFAIVAVCISLVIVLITFVIPTVKYNRAVEKYGKKWADTVKNASIGDTIVLGIYEQDNNTANGKEAIEWTVLKKNGMSLLLISKYALDCRQYNMFDTDITWEKCSLRTWLNGTFLNTAFSSDEQEMIAMTNVRADNNPEYSTNPGNATNDKVFLLSITEAEKYFSSNNARQCKPTKYAVANGAYVKSDSGNCFWWLRSPGKSQDTAADVYYEGTVRYRGPNVRWSEACVRPALWINLDS